VNLTSQEPRFALFEDDLRGECSQRGSLDRQSQKRDSYIYYFGEGYWDNGQKETAISYYRKALEADPLNPPAVQKMKSLEEKKSSSCGIVFP
jgi:tetratricopeptide (TPR) repeat protein